MEPSPPALRSPVRRALGDIRVSSYLGRDRGEALTEADATVLDLLTGEPVVWSVDELAREIGDQVTAVESAARLHAARLAHRLGYFVFAAPAAARAARLPR